MKCKKCYDGKPFLAPELVQSGYRPEFGYICPVCNTLHDSSGNIKTWEELKNDQRKRISIRNYNEKWFN